MLFPRPDRRFLSPLYPFYQLSSCLHLGDSSASFKVQFKHHFLWGGFPDPKSGLGPQTVSPKCLWSWHLSCFFPTDLPTDFIIYKLQLTHFTCIYWVLIICHFVDHREYRSKEQNSCRLSWSLKLVGDEISGRPGEKAWRVPESLSQPWVRAMHLIISSYQKEN